MKPRVLRLKTNGAVVFETGDIIYDVKNGTLYDVSSEEQTLSLIEMYTDAMNGRYYSSDLMRYHIPDANGTALVLQCVGFVQFPSKLKANDNDHQYTFVKILHDGRLRTFIWLSESVK